MLLRRGQGADAFGVGLPASSTESGGDYCANARQLSLINSLSVAMVLLRQSSLLRDASETRRDENYNV